MIDVSDLIGIPYQEYGRTKDGFDCYGLCLEVLRRAGYKLNDLVYTNHDISLSDKHRPTLNVKKLAGPKEAAIIEMLTHEGTLHIGICLDEKEFIHTTNQGVRISRIGCFPIRGFYGACTRI